MFNFFVFGTFLKYINRLALILIIPFALTACKKHGCHDSLDLHECLTDVAERGANAILLEKTNNFVAGVIQLRNNLAVIGAKLQAVIGLQPSVATGINEPLILGSPTERVAPSHFTLSESRDPDPKSMDHRPNHNELNNACEDESNNVSALESINKEQLCNDSLGLQNCLANAAKTGANIIVLEKKQYFITETIELRDNLTIIGKGPQTVISWHPSVANYINKPLMHTSSADNVTLSNFKLSGSLDQSPTSIDLRYDHIGLYYECEGEPSNAASLECQNLNMQNIEVEFFSHGIHIKGTRNVQAIDLDLHDNGNIETDLFHNIYYRRVVDVLMKQTTPSKGGFYNSPRGHGIRASYLYNATFEGLQVYGNADHGVNFSDIGNTVFNNVVIKENCKAPVDNCSQYACYGGACDIKFTSVPK